jgi:nickel-dependent lactate racemase
MQASFKYGRKTLSISLPDEAICYSSQFREASGTISEMLVNAIDNPVGGLSLSTLVRNRKAGKVVIVVSDITRPIPYFQFLPLLIEKCMNAGVEKEEITILIATGMHRPSTREERLEMFGSDITDRFSIIDHEADNAACLEDLEASGTGRKVQMNKHYVNAGVRIITGLVEPHFMAGFSGGRKAICPGLVSLKAIQNFHGYEFLSNPNAKNATMAGNPCHDESSYIASLVPPDFNLNIILDNHKEVNAIIGGDLKLSHQRSVEYVKKACCPVVREEADLVITSCGGHPLDTTFYQCVKALVSCLPAVKKNGRIVAFGSCTEGIGSKEYTDTMLRYSGRYKEFLQDISSSEVFTKDQWQFQMHCRAIEKLGTENIFFLTDGLEAGMLKKLSVNTPEDSHDTMEGILQKLVDKAVNEGKKIAFIPEGPYCAPVEG